LALLERLADAQDRNEARREGGLDLGVGDLLGLAMVFATLRVADRHVGAAERRQHRAGDLTGVGAGLVGGDVLRAVGDGELGCVDRDLDGAQVHEGRQHSGLDLRHVHGLELVAEILDKGEALLPVEVHLPVARHERGAGGHSESSSRMEMPGRSLPSMSSRLAPPPVEMCEKRDSSNPRMRTAAAESPPPTTVNAPLAVAVTRAWATARVPPAKASNSNTPAGPFHTTVFASAIAAAKAACE